MMKRKIAALLAAATVVTAWMPGLTLYAMEKEETGKKEETEAAVSESEAMVFDARVMKILAAGMDPEILELLLENPKLLALVMPELHVTVTDSAVTIAVKGREDEPRDPGDSSVSSLNGIVRTNGGRLNVRSGAGTGYGVITQLENGAGVKVAGEENGWAKIELPAEFGYVCARYLEIREMTPEKKEEGYSFDIDGEMALGFLRMFEDVFRPEPAPAPADPEGLTPDGNLTLVDDLGPATGVGQQFLTMVSKNGNYFYMVIDRNDKGEENVHLLNMVDERDLMDLMAKDDKGTYEAISEAEKAAAEAAAQAEKEAAEKAAAEAKEKEKAEKAAKKPGNMASLLLVPVILAASGGAWFFLQAKKKKKEKASPDPDAGYEEDEDDDGEDYAAGDEAEDEADEPESDEESDEESEGRDAPEDSDDPEEI